MEPDRRLLDSFVDGELAPREMERVAGLLETYPAWDAYVRKQESLRTMLRSPFAGMDEAVPRRLTDAAMTAPVSWRWRLRQALASGFLLRRLAPAGAALAAGLVIGITLRPGSDFGTDAAGQVLARGALGNALDTRLASAGAGSGARIGISFRNHGGEDCRTFSSGESAGLACHRGGRWVVDMLTRHVSEDAGAAYQMAGSDMPDAVRRAVNASIEGAPFDAAAESRARAGGWNGR